jgi:hypothetical protein
MDAEKEVRQLLKQHGTPERHNKHEAFRINGHLIVITNTKTDRRGWLNKRSEVRRAMTMPPGPRCNGK